MICKSPILVLKRVANEANSRVGVRGRVGTSPLGGGVYVDREAGRSFDGGLGGRARDVNKLRGRIQTVGGSHLLL